MTKRPHSGGLETPGSCKRQKKILNTSDAAQLLLQHSDGLIACLTSLQKTGNLDAANEQRLASLSTTLVPAFKSLRHGTDQEETGEACEGNENSPARDPVNTAVPTSTTPSGLLPPLRNLTEWTVPEIPRQPPPLPPIPDIVLEKAAFFHEGARIHRHDVSYERLEFVGDAFIYHLASEFLAQTFPRHSPGQCTHMRERLLCNAKLSEYALHYGFDKRAVLPEEFRGNGRGNGGNKATQKERQKVLGDIFEAYVGALIRSGPDGDTNAIRWLKALWSMEIASEIREEYRLRTAATQGVDRDRSAKDRLVGLIGCPGVKIRYDDIPGNKLKLDKKNHLPLFHVGLFVDAWGKTNEQLATASALSKKEAREKAATRAIENKKIMKFYVEKKKAYLEAQIL